MAKLICLDPGHGYATLGKRSPDSKYYEYEHNWDMCLKLKAAFERCGFKTIMTRSDPYTDTTLAKRCNIANNANADLFISMHSNAAGNGGWYNARGWSAFVYSKTGTSYKIASMINNVAFPAIKNTFGLKTRGVLVGNFAVIRDTDMPAILIESAFHDNKEDVNLLASQTFRRAHCEYIVKGVCKYYGVTYVESKVSIPSVLTTGTVTTGKLNVRIKPNASGKIIGGLNKGCTIYITKSVDGWYQILYGENIGYVSGDYVSANKIISSEPEIKKDEPTVENVTTSTEVPTNNITIINKIGTVKSGINLNVRDKDSVNTGKVLGILSGGTKVLITGKTSNNWYQIKYKGNIGYVSGSYIENIINSNVTLIDDIGTITPNSGLNVRNAPYTSGIKLGTLTKNSKVTIMGKTSNNWYLIDFNNNLGYVSGQYIKL